MSDYPIYYFLTNTHLVCDHIAKKYTTTANEAVCLTGYKPPENQPAGLILRGLPLVVQKTIFSAGRA